MKFLGHMKKESLANLTLTGYNKGKRNKEKQIDVRSMYHRNKHGS